MLRPESFLFAAILTALVAFGPLFNRYVFTVFTCDEDGFWCNGLSSSVNIKRIFSRICGFTIILWPLIRQVRASSGSFIWYCGLWGGKCRMFLSTTIEGLILARFFQAFGACSGPVLGRAVVRDVYGQERAAQVLAYMGSAMALAPAVAPMFGGYLQVWFGWQANFVAISIFAFILIGLVFFLIRETNAHQNPEALKPARIVGNYAQLLKHREFLGYVLLNSFVFSGLFAFISGSSFVFIDIFGLEPNIYGICFGVVVCGYITGTLLAGRFSRKLGGPRMLRYGSSLAMVAGLLLAGIAYMGGNTATSVVAPMVLFMVAVGLVMPNSMAGAIGPFPKMAGSASALMGFLQMTIAACVGGSVGLLHNGTHLPMVSAIAVTGVLSFVTYFVFVRSKI